MPASRTLRYQGAVRTFRCARAHPFSGRIESESMRKDGLCSLSGGLLSLGVWASAEASAAFWWLDALVALVVAAALICYGRAELSRHGGQWRRPEFWREADGKTSQLKGAQEMDGLAVEDPDELL